MRHARHVLLLALVAAGCGDEAPPSLTPPASTAPACPAATVDVPSSGEYPSAAVIERRAREMVTRDVDPHACLVRVVARRETLLVEASHEGRTMRAQLASSFGTTTESLAPHAAAQALLRTLLDAGVESAISSGRGVALGFADHAALCYRAVASEPRCVRAPPVVAFDSVTEPSAGRLVVRALADAAPIGTELEMVLGDTIALTARRGPIQTGRALGTPPPDVDLFVRVRSARSEASTPAVEDAARSVARAMPTGARSVRLETRIVGATRVVLLSRCEGMLAHCVSVVATREGTTLRLAPSFATDAARIDVVEDAATLAPGAIGLRVLEAGFHEASASEMFVVNVSGELAVWEVPLGHETERGDEEMVTEGCYRALAIDGPSRVRLSDARGWSGSHSDARGWNVVARRTCAPDAALCLDAAIGFGPCP